MCCNSENLMICCRTSRCHAGKCRASTRCRASTTASCTPGRYFNEFSNLIRCCWKSRSCMNKENHIANTTTGRTSGRYTNNCTNLIMCCSKVGCSVRKHRASARHIISTTARCTSGRYINESTNLIGCCTRSGCCTRKAFCKREEAEGTLDTV